MEINSDQEWIEYLTRPARILLVEDDENIVSTFKSFSGLFNCDMDHAGTAEEAIAMFEPHKYTLVFLDIVLPEGSGIDVFRHIQNVDPMVSVAIITGYLTMDLIDKIYQIGPASFVRKPTDFNTRFLVKVFGRLRIRRKESEHPFPQI